MYGYGGQGFVPYGSMPTAVYGGAYTPQPSYVSSAPMVSYGTARPRTRRASLGTYIPEASLSYSSNQSFGVPAPYYEMSQPTYVTAAAPADPYAQEYYDSSFSSSRLAANSYTLPSPARSKTVYDEPLVATPPAEDPVYYTTTGLPSKYSEPQDPDAAGNVTVVEHKVVEGHVVNIPHKRKATEVSPQKAASVAAPTPAASAPAPTASPAVTPIKKSAPMASSTPATSSSSGASSVARTPNPNIRGVNESLADAVVAAKKEETIYTVQVGEALTTGLAARQGDERRTQLEALRDKIGQFIDDLASQAIVVDDTFDESVVTNQIDKMLPSAVNTELQDEEEERRNAGPQTYAGLKKLLAEVKEQSKTVAPEYNVSFTTMIEAASSAVDLLDGTVNPQAESEFISFLDGVLRDLHNFMNVPIPNTADLHQDAMKADAACVAFEKQREQYDWTESMSQAENSLYTKVNSVLEETAKESANSAQVLADLIKFTHPAKPVDPSNLIAKKEKFIQCRNSLQEREAIEEGTFNKMKAGLEKEMERAKAAEEVAHSNAVRLGAHIKKLSQDMMDAYFSVWQTQKTQAIIERSIAMLQTKQRINDSLAEHEGEEIESLIQDCDAAIQVSSIAEAMMKDVNQQLEDIRLRKEQEVSEDLFKIEVERLKLVSRKYYQTSLAMFAATSSIEILRQEQEGVLVKKKRSNAAKNSEWVAECSREFDELERKINVEEDNRAQLLNTCNSIAQVRAEVFESLGRLPLSKASKAKIPPLEVEWKLLGDRLQTVRQEQLQKVELANHLDAGILSHSFSRHD